MEETKETKCLVHQDADCDCRDKPESVEDNDSVDLATKSSESKGEDITETSPNNSNEVQKGGKNTTNQSAKKLRNQRRRQRNNIQRIPGVPLRPLFPNQRNQPQKFDLRNMLRGPTIQDATAWWHSTGQNNYQPAPAKKARTDDNSFIPSKDRMHIGKNLTHKVPDGKSIDGKEDIINPRKYVIVVNDYPKTLLTEEQSHQIQSSLTSQILSFGEQGEAPKFWSCYLKQGALVVSCVDDTSKDWLVENVPSLALDNDVKLKTGEAKDILLTTKVSLFVPKFLKNIDSGQVLKLLKTQNNGLRTDLWNLLEHKEEEKGQHFSVAIDEDSFVAIKMANYKVHLGLSLVKFSEPQFFRITPLTPSASPATAPAAQAAAPAEPVES